MAEYDKTYQQTHDIDWFCKIGNTAMHFASNGGLLPNKVNNREVNSHIQHVVVTMEDVVSDANQILVNSAYVYQRIGANENRASYERYIESFVAMAKKGFVSFDRMIEADTYMWIAKPKKAVEVATDELPRFDEDICHRYALEGDVVHVDCLNRVE